MVDPSRNGEVDEDEIWEAVQGLLRCCLSVVTGASLLLVIFDSSKSVAGVGYLFPLLCMAKPLLVSSDLRWRLGRGRRRRSPRTLEVTQTN